MPTAAKVEKQKRRGSNVLEFRSRDEAHFLSNYFLEPDGSSVQFEFQREKSATDKDRLRFGRLGGNPMEAKELGHSITPRKDWEKVKVGIMHRLVRDKFLSHPLLAGQLLATGTAELVKRSDCGESFWGKNEAGEGENQLGKILMAVRTELRGG